MATECLPTVGSTQPSTGATSFCPRFRRLRQLVNFVCSKKTSITFLKFVFVCFADLAVSGGRLRPTLPAMRDYFVFLPPLRVLLPGPRVVWSWLGQLVTVYHYLANLPVINVVAAFAVVAALVAVPADLFKVFIFLTYFF
jgi:hypothetical protein